MFPQVEEIYKIINKYDPLLLIDEGCPVDEYLPEADMIYSAWSDGLSFEDFHRKLYDVFRTQFKGILDKTQLYFLPMAREIWSYMKMNETV